MTNTLLEMSVGLVTAHLAQNRMAAHEVPDFIRSVHDTLKDLQVSAARPVTVAAAEAASAPSVTKELPFPEVEQAKAATTPAPAPLPAVAQASEAEEEAPRAEEPRSNKTAYLRDNDLTDPVFAGLDPWLAARISPKIAKKLDPNNDVHPTVFPDHLVCLEDGQTVTLLRPYIKNRYGLTPAEYIDKWNLPDEYPTAPPAYIEAKRKMALKRGLGRSVRARRENPKVVQAKATRAPRKNAAEAPAPTARATRAKAAEASAPTAARKGGGSRRKLSLFQKDEHAE
jgi:predicted transcriptional regulator